MKIPHSFTGGWRSINQLMNNIIILNMEFMRQLLIDSGRLLLHE